MRKILPLLFCLTTLARAQEPAVTRFYNDYLVAFKKIGGNPDNAFTKKFLLAHQAQLDPRLLADWVKAEDYLSDRKHTRGAYWEYDPITGSSGLILKNLKFGLPGKLGTPVEFDTTDMRDRPMHMEIYVHVLNGKINDIRYHGGGLGLRESIYELLKLPISKER